MTPDSLAREHLGFAPAVERNFSFLTGYGFRRTRSEPTFVRFEAAQRYLEIFHGVRSYAVGIHIGLIGEADAEFSLPEIAYAFGERYQELAGRTKESVEAAVGKLAAQVQRYSSMLNGEMPIEGMLEYRQRLTDYYAGKSKEHPDQRYRKLP